METPPKPTKQTSDTKTTNINNAHPIPQSLIPSSYINNRHNLAYKECLKNHAAPIGGHALDGCGEFMPSTDPNSLKCAVCDCHRNFHRQEPDQHYPPTPHFLTFHHHQIQPHVLLKLSTAAPDEHKHKHRVASTPVTPTAENASSRKRFRTKFSREQKDKMRVFAEKLGWRMHKSDEVIVEEFCKEIGVNKNVIKVWMHNNKTTHGKRDPNCNVAATDNDINSQHL